MKLLPLLPKKLYHGLVLLLAWALAVALDAPAEAEAEADAEAPADALLMALCVMTGSSTTEMTGVLITVWLVVPSTNCLPPLIDQALPPNEPVLKPPDIVVELDEPDHDEAMA